MTPVPARSSAGSPLREAETARHVAAGAGLVERFERWTVLGGPAGTTYCITGRWPETQVPG